MSKKDQKIALNTEFNPMILGTILRRHWFLPLLYVSFFSLMAFFYLRYTKPIYRSNSIVQLIQDDKTSQILGTSSLVEDKNLLSTEIELLRSDVLFARAIEKLNLETSIFAEGEILTKDLYRAAPFEIIVYHLSDSSLIEKRIDITIDKEENILLMDGDKKLVSGTLNSHLKNEQIDIYVRALNKPNLTNMLSENRIFFKINNREGLIRKFKEFLMISLVDNNAKTIEISYEYYNPRLSFDIVNGVLNEYLDWERDSKQTAANKTLKFIDTQLDSLSRILRNSKDSLNNYQKRVKILDPDDYGQQLSTNINALTDKTLQIDEELYTVRIIHDKIKNNPNRLEIYRLIPEMIGKKSFEGTVLKQIEDLNSILEQKDDLLREVTNENVQVVILNERLKNRVASIHKSMEVIEERLLSERQILQNKINQEEKTYFGEGNGTDIFKTKFGNIGVQICYDLFFPDVSMELAQKGADIIINLAASPTTSRPLFHRVLPARAIETTCYYAFVNNVGTQGNLVFAGESCIFDPRGKLMGEIDKFEEGILTCEIPLEKVEKYRDARPVLRDSMNRD